MKAGQRPARARIFCSRCDEFGPWFRTTQRAADYEVESRWKAHQREQHEVTR